MDMVIYFYVGRRCKYILFPCIQLHTLLGFLIDRPIHSLAKGKLLRATLRVF